MQLDEKDREIFQYCLNTIVASEKKEVMVTPPLQSQGGSLMPM